MLLKKFIVTLQGDMSDLYLFQLGIERMKQNKDKYKKEFNYYNRMANNWFPLVLLEKMSVVENYDTATCYKMVETFSVLNSYADFQSYYIENSERRGDKLKLLVKGKDAVLLEEMLRRIVCFYNLNCEYKEKGVKKEAPKTDKTKTDKSKKENLDKNVK